MPQEIERKFLVKDTSYREMAYASSQMKQGYICNTKTTTVRVRISDGKGFLTIKGASNHSGLSRYEWEREIPLSDAMDLMQLCEPNFIDKDRYRVKIGAHVYEIDEFHGANQGLVIAEIELNSEDEAFERAPFLGEEVTGDVKYYNASLRKYPYNQWGKNNQKEGEKGVKSIL